MGQSAVWQSSLITYVVTPNKTTSPQTTLHHDIIVFDTRKQPYSISQGLSDDQQRAVLVALWLFFYSLEFWQKTKQKLRSSVQKYVAFCCVGKNDQEHSLHHAGNNRLLYITNQLSLLNCSILASNLVRNSLCLSREQNRRKRLRQCGELELKHVSLKNVKGNLASARTFLWMHRF